MTGNNSWTGQTRGLSVEVQRTLVAGWQGVCDMADELDSEDAADARAQLSYHTDLLKQIEQARHWQSKGGQSQAILSCFVSHQCS